MMSSGFGFCTCDCALLYDIFVGQTGSLHVTGRVPMGCLPLTRIFPLVSTEAPRQSLIGLACQCLETGVGRLMDGEQKNGGSQKKSEVMSPKEALGGGGGWIKEMPSRQNKAKQVPTVSENITSR